MTDYWENALRAHADWRGPLLTANVAPVVKRIERVLAGRRHTLIKARNLHEHDEPVVWTSVSATQFQVRDDGFTVAYSVDGRVELEWGAWTGASTPDGWRGQPESDQYFITIRGGRDEGFEPRLDDLVMVERRAASASSGLSGWTMAVPENKEV